MPRKKKANKLAGLKPKTKKLTKYQQRILPNRTGYVFIHIPDKEWEDISWCHHVAMTWQHLIAYPKRKDSKARLKALRVCSKCVDQCADYYDLTD